MYFQYLCNAERTTVVTYDDTWSLKDKAVFAAQAGMAGCFTWSLDQVRKVDPFKLWSVLKYIG